VERPEDVADFKVALDGTIWAIDRPSERERWVIRTFDGQTWTTHHATDNVVYRDAHLEIGPDGRVWSGWLPEDGGPKVIGYFDGAGWRSIGEADAVALALAGPDDVWVSGFAGSPLRNYADGTWQTVGLSGGIIAAGGDGTFWSIGGRGPDYATGDLLRFDGSDWIEWTWEDLGFEIEGGYGIVRGPLEVAPDGSVWIGSPVTIPPTPSDLDLDTACDGVRRFDGTTTEYFLTDLCVRELEVAADGSVWVLAGTGKPDIDYGADLALADLYVITPEALAVIG
jgi:hypothetical protein